MARQGSTTARGYGAKHQAERAKWKPLVDAGRVLCHAKQHKRECTLRGNQLGPGIPWDLGHTEDRTAWTGPEFRGCNRADGGRRRHRRRVTRHAIL